MVFVDLGEEPGPEVVEIPFLVSEVGLDKLGGCHFLKLGEEVGVVEGVEFREKAFFDL